MLVRIMSDIHNEFCREESGADYLIPELPDDKESILILAGDIGLLNREQTGSAFSLDVQSSSEAFSLLKETTNGITATSRSTPIGMRSPGCVLKTPIQISLFWKKRKSSSSALPSGQIFLAATPSPCSMPVRASMTIV
jgi:hypothetical protein